MEFPGFSVFARSLLKKLVRLPGQHLWFVLLFWLVPVGSAQAAVELRVAIKNEVKSVKVGSSTKAVVRNGAGRKLGEIYGMDAFYAKSKGSDVALGSWRSGQLWIEPSGEGYVWIGDRWYRGSTHIIRNHGGLSAVNYVDLKDYLYSVVGGEMNRNWHLEALKAQAVAARSYALYKRSKSSNPLFDLDTTTATQVYQGLQSESRSTHRAVNATAEQVMTYNGHPILAAFHSSSGGHTENVGEIWSKSLPYLRGVVDYDQRAPVYQWTKTFSGRELGRLIGEVEKVTSILPEQTTSQGRIKMMKVIGDHGTTRVSGGKLRKVLDLRSTLFTVSAVGNSFQIAGKGFGHGIGLSQWGARYLAQQGTNYRQILGHYYRGVNLASYESVNIANVQPATNSKKAKD